MARKDVFGVEVEVGDIVFSAPRHKYSGSPSVGQVTGVFDSGRVTIKLPYKKSIYAYERGAPQVDVESYRYGPELDENGQVVYEEWTDYYGRKQSRVKQTRQPYTYKSKDYTVVDHEWVWVKRQAADVTLIVLRKGGSKLKEISDILDEGELSRNLNLDYDAPTPQLG